MIKLVSITFNVVSQITLSIPSLKNLQPKFYFMINPITFVSYLKLTLKRFPNIYEKLLIETVVKIFPCFSRKKIVNKHKKNVRSFIADISLLSHFKCLFGETLHLGFNNFSSFPLLFQ